MQNVNPIFQNTLRNLFKVYSVTERVIEDWRIDNGWLLVNYFDNVNNKPCFKKWHINFLKTWVGLEEPKYGKRFIEKDVDDQFDGTANSIRDIKFVNWEKAFAHPEFDDVVRRFFNHFMKNDTIRKNR